MIPSEIHNQVPKLEDDKVDYAEVSHNSIMSPNNNSEIGKCRNQYAYSYNYSYYNINKYKSRQDYYLQFFPSTIRLILTIYYPFQ